MVLFLILSGALTFFLGDLLGANRADLRPFFQFLPWVFLLFIPSLTMGLWAEEKSKGTIELLLTLPISTAQANLAKYISVLIFMALTLLLTFPFVTTIAYLGDPDMLVIIGGYFGAFLVGCQFVAVGLFCSSVSRNQVVAFVLSSVICFAILVLGTPVIITFFTSWLPSTALDILGRLSLIAAFDNWSRGIFSLGDIVSVTAISAIFVISSAHIVDDKKAG